MSGWLRAMRGLIGFGGRQMRVAWLGLIVCLGLGACMNAEKKDTLRDAALYAYGPYQYALNVERLRQRNAAAGIGLNAIAHNRELADHTSRAVTAPNADTIYSSAILELSYGPVELFIPDTEDRYVSVMLMDIFTDVIATVGTGRDGQAGGRYWIAAPDWAQNWTGDIPDGVTLITTPGPDAWLLARLFVSGPQDLDAARAVQSQITVQPVSATQDPAVPVIPTQPPSAENMLRVVNTLLGRAPDHPHTQRAGAFGALGIQPGNATAWDTLSAAQKQLWRIAFTRTQDGLKTALSERGLTQGWRRAPQNLARFGDDDASRAAVSLIGFGALQAEDATYFSADSDTDGQRLSGSHDYRIRLDPAAVPVDAFWSLSLYRVEADGRRFFIDNPIGRNVVNSATPDLLIDPDGRLTLHISAARPEATVNWIPAPDGDFALIFRTYLPRDPILSGTWTPPAIQRVTNAG